MKVDISKKIITLDNQKLSDEIEKYECISNQTAYLFMSQNTMKALTDLIATRIPFMEINTDDCILAKYKERKVFQNDELEFGEIEIR
ncbi:MULTISPECIES: hypothetical protein [Clostridia]|jgi:hypothetical protein|uniref:Uncharacterized protein n=2 Tax=Enterocloster bolteae TaxID=208479 RepID=A0A414AIX5_9FIRM|nr:MULTISPECIES: hypothetical protein [Clostridia]ENZ34889.1 hypothetical protein HMPREF1097_04281 [Enterocloster bolteae 90B8]MSA02230.1 hypothetical protein [Lactonifactor sp. BIOML-A5]MSA08014.1 hypothetical protein [Lactonifactor sp. BIOML-A4]MSA12630.1 hypothetical protein [Lactonifactor sp. BIOML-A3]MSA16668.1 hypothetical protein [Lactonifactor sp. BIOML-A2]